MGGKDDENQISAQAPLDYTNERIVLTTYPGQAGVSPIPLNWYAPGAKERGAILASRLPGPGANLKRRNAIGAYAGSYSIYRAVAVAIGALSSNQPHSSTATDSTSTGQYYRPDFTNTEPIVRVGPYPQWAEQDKIVSIDPFGHMVQEAFSKDLAEGKDIRPTIAITKAHMRVPELQAKGTFTVDGNIVCNDEGELVVTKGAIDPVWYLPGVAARFGISEVKLRRTLFEETGGMYPELITRPDLSVFLPPIGGLSIYVFGPIEYLADPSKELTVRVHDECNGSDVFGSDICTCRPYLIYGIKLAVETAQKGGAGLIVYFRKEGRALGEVTKYLVYNARKRQIGGDRASTYFQRTESVAGVKDMRFQALMPDVLHWLGVRKIDNFVSMSNMKYNAITKSGIEIKNRIAIPSEWMPPDSQVEIEAKIADGYFTPGIIPTTNDLERTKGRSWDDIQH